MKVYADHNLLINCVNRPTWRNAVIDAQRAGRIQLVLSPWHFFEYANGVEHAGADELMRFVEEVQPKWILERSDLQLFELWIVWRQIWERSTDSVAPIGTFAEVVAVLSKVNDHRLDGVGIREYVMGFADSEGVDLLRRAVAEHREIATEVRTPFLERRSSSRFQRGLDLNHVAIQLARIELRTSNPDRIFPRAAQILREQPMATQIEMFIYWGCVRMLKCYQVERALSEELLTGKAALDSNRYVDRQHACVGLPYCDRFITDDVDLTKRCAHVKSKLPFPIASLLTAGQLIEELA